MNEEEIKELENDYHKEITERCKKTFGEFKEFKKKFLEMKFGNMPPHAHPSPRSIALVRRMDDWPGSYNILGNMEAICYGCQHQNIFSPCKKCLKAMVGECKQFKQEALEEDSRIRKEERRRKKQ